MVFRKLDLDKRSQPTELFIINFTIAFLGCVYGLQYRYPHSWASTIFRLCSVVVLAAIVFLIVRAYERQEEPRYRETWNEVALFLSLGQLSLTEFFFLPTKAALLAGALTWIVAGGAFYYKKIFHGVVALLLIGCGIFIYKLVVVPLADNGGDMLAFISRAIDIFRSGGDPYTASYRNIDANPFFYLPAQWLVYLPAQIAKIDLRLTNLFCFFSSVVIVEWKARRSAAWLRASIYPILLSPVALQMMISGQVWPYWLFTILAAIAYLEERLLLSAILLGIAISVRQTGLVWAAVLAAGLFGRIPFSRWLATISLGVITAAVLTLPFASSLADWKQIISLGPAQALVEAHLEGNPASQVGLSNLIEAFGFAGSEVYIQACLGLAALVAAFLMRDRPPKALLAFAGTAYTAIMLVNPYIHYYYYIAGLLVASAGFVAPKIGWATSGRRQSMDAAPSVYEIAAEHSRSSSV